MHRGTRLNSRAPAIFAPPRRAGLVFQISVALILAAGASFALVVALRSPKGPDFLAGVLLVIIFATPVPLFLYRTYALLGAHYRLDRDGLRLYWGLRVEDIPLPDIEWIRPARELGMHLPLPLLVWTGGVLGRRQVESLGPVEFIASDLGRLLLVATPQRIFVISPAETSRFLRAFQDVNELGSLTPISAQSVYPASLLGQVWADRAGRALLITSLILGLALLVWVSLAIPRHASLPLGFLADGRPGEGGPPERLLLLPVLDGLILVINVIGGFYFYRRQGQRPLSYLLWGSAAFTTFILLLAVGFITNT